MGSVNMTTAAARPTSAVVLWRRGADLTRREAQVLELVRDRYRNADIAAILGISKRTVESHMAALLAKLGAVNRSQLMALPPSAPGLARPRATPWPPARGIALFEHAGE